MNYQDLAQQLTSLSVRLEKHAHKLDGTPLGHAARKLKISLDHFDGTLEAYLAARKSGVLELETIYRSPSARRHLTVEILRRALRETASKRLKAETLPVAKIEYLETVKRLDKVGDAVNFLRRHFAAAVEVRAGGKEKLALQREFIALGKLPEEAFVQETARRTFGELRRLAGANGIRFTDKTSKPRLLQSIRRYASRAAANLATAD